MEFVLHIIVNESKAEKQGPSLALHAHLGFHCLSRITNPTLMKILKMVDTASGVQG
jgi:hypothetical protein